MPEPQIVTRLKRYHVPNTPRTHDGHGHKLEESPQCAGCLRAWPCETKQLLTIIDDLVAQDA